MTTRGRVVLALGVVVYLTAWVFGSRALYPVATGLVLAAVLALGWVRLSTRSPHVHRHGATRDVLEGDDVRIDLVVEATSAVPPPSLVAHERPGRLAERRVELYRAGRRRFAGGFELRRVPRGRYAFDTVRLTIEDPFALARASLVQGEPQALVVNSASRDVQTVTSEGEWHRALEVLAGAEPTAHTRAFALLQLDGGVVAGSLELVVVTARVDVPLADRLVQRALSRRGTSLVYVEATSGPEPQLLRLQAAGIPVAVVRPGDDLAAALGGREARVA